MEQSPSSEANRFSASQEIPRILWNPKGHYRIQKYPPPVHVVVQWRSVNSAVDKASITYRLQTIPNSNPGEHRRLKIRAARKDSPEYMLVGQPECTVWCWFCSWHIQNDDGFATGIYSMLVLQPEYTVCWFCNIQLEKWLQHRSWECQS